MRIAALMAVAAALCLTAAAAMAELGTKEQQDACKPDVFRLCNKDIPVQAKIVACLKQNRTQLSPACRKVFS